MKTRYFLTLIVLMLIASITANAQAPWDSDMEFRDGSSFHEFRPEQVNPFVDAIYPGIIVGSATEGPDGGTGGPYVWQGTRWYPLWSDFIAGDNISITHDGNGDVTINAVAEGIAGVTVEEESVTVGQYDNLNFLGIGATAVDNGTQANVHIPGTLVQSASSDIGFASGINFDIEWPHYVDIQENIATVNIKRGTGYPLMVAAYNASATEREYATHLCDGVSDEIEINQALTEAKAHPNGLKVLLSSGDFHPVGAIEMDEPGLWMEGTGIRITRIHPVADYGAVINLGGGVASDAYGLQVSNMTIDSGTQFTGYALADITGSNHYSDSLFEKLYITNFPGDAFFGSNINSNQNIYRNIWFYNIGGNCFDFDQSYGTFEGIYAQDVDLQVFSFNDRGQHTIDNTVVSNVGGLLYATGSDNLQVSNARIYNTSSDGIYIESTASFYGQNIFMNTIGGDGIDINTNQVTIDNFVIETATEAGVEISGGAVNITNSRFNGTTVGIFGINPMDSFTLSNCTFANITGMTVYLDGYDEVMVSNNIFNESTNNTMYLNKGQKIEISNNFFNGVTNIGIEVAGVGDNGLGKITGNTFWGDDATAFCIGFSESLGFSPTDFVISNNTVLGIWDSFFAVSGTVDPYPVFIGNDYFDSNSNKVVQLSRGPAGVILSASQDHIPDSDIFEGGINPWFDGTDLKARYKIGGATYEITLGGAGSGGITGVMAQDSGSDVVRSATFNFRNNMTVSNVGGIPTIDAAAGGGGGSSTNIYTVAASNAPAEVIAAASWTVDGTADESQIQEAITQAGLASNGGVIELSAGDFYIASMISLSTSNITIKGQGRDLTRLHLAANVDMWSLGAVSNVRFEGMSMNGNKAVHTTATNDCIIGSGAGSNAQFINLEIKDFRDVGISMANRTGNDYFYDLIISGCDDRGINYTHGDDSVFDKIQINAGSFGIVFDNSAERLILNKIRIENSTVTGLDMITAHKALVSNCVFTGNTGTTVNVNDSDDVVFTGNQFYSNGNAVNDRIVYILSGSLRGSYTENKFNANNGWGFYISNGLYTDINQNSFDSNLSYCIYMDTSQHTKIQNNLFRNTSESSIYLNSANCDDILIQNNNFVDLTDYAIETAQSGSRLKIDGNYFTETSFTYVLWFYRVFDNISITNNTFYDASGTSYIIRYDGGWASPVDYWLSGNRILGSWAGVFNAEPTGDVFSSNEMRKDSTGAEYLEIMSGDFGVGLLGTSASAKIGLATDAANNIANVIWVDQAATTNPIATSWDLHSDPRLKEDIQPVGETKRNEISNNLDNLPVIEFDWKFPQAQPQRVVFDDVLDASDNIIQTAEEAYQEALQRWQTKRQAYRNNPLKNNQMSLDIEHPDFPEAFATYNDKGEKIGINMSQVLIQSLVGLQEAKVEIKELKAKVEALEAAP